MNSFFFFFPFPFSHETMKQPGRIRRRKEEKKERTKKDFPALYLFAVALSLLQ